MNRRHFIALTGATTTATLAGCLGDSDTDSPEAVVEAYFEAESEEEQEDLLHPVTIADDEQGSITVNQVWSAENAEAEVIEEDIADDEIEAMMVGITDDEGVETLQNADTALVEVEVQPPDGLGELSEDFTAEALTATDNGDWKFVKQT